MSTSVLFDPRAAPARTHESANGLGLSPGEIAYARELERLVQRAVTELGQVSQSLASLEGDNSALYGRLAEENARRQRVERELLDDLRRRDEFLAGAAHDLNSPLSALHLQVHSLLHGGARGGVSEPIRQRLEAMEKQIEYLMHVVRTMLDVSQVASGPLPFEHTEVDLVAVARATAAHFVPAGAASDSITVTGVSAARGHWDRVRVEQVLSNLLSNAVKYGHGGPIVVTIETAPERVRLSVRDGGIGIAVEDQARVFQKFVRAAPGREGLGLGLWITKQIVDAMGGSIGVTSEIGRGSIFTVELPLRTP